jgi:hypothetical protein
MSFGSKRSMISILQHDLLLQKFKEVLSSLLFLAIYTLLIHISTTYGSRHGSGELFVAKTRIKSRMTSSSSPSTSAFFCYHHSTIVSYLSITAPLKYVTALTSQKLSFLRAEVRNVISDPALCWSQRTGSQLFLAYFP